jgi:hypothetical protein
MPYALPVSFRIRQGEPVLRRPIEPALTFVQGWQDGPIPSDPFSISFTNSSASNGSPRRGVPVAEIGPFYTLNLSV